MTGKLLTIITVTKNCVDTIERTLKSVELSKTDEVEYMIVDGVSNDGTLEIIGKYSKRIDRFICEPDAGIYNAMNKGVANSSGKFIVFINGDDELIPDGVEKVLALLPSCQEQIVCAATLVVGDELTPTFSYIPNPSRLIYWDSIPHPSAFVRRELLVQVPFREDLKIASDYDFFLKAFLSGALFKLVPYQSARHYYGGVSSDRNRMQSEMDLILKENLGRWRACCNKLIFKTFRGIGKIRAFLLGKFG
jgi:glycosyltransferase involved in cell wall biosynthesis